MNIKSLTLGVSIALLSTNSSAVLKVDVPFVVTPTKTQQALSDVIVPTVVITREDIENTPSTDVAELLRFHAGLDIARTGGDGSQTSLFIRGTESDHVLVLIDGVKINPATLGQPSLQTISPEMIERIEVVKGPRSSLYGSSALGGVVNIITRKGVNGFSVSVTAGDQNTAKYGFTGGIQEQGVDATVAYETFSTDGYLDKASSTKEHASSNESLQFRVGTNLSNTRIELSHLQNDGSYEYDSFGEKEQEHDNKVTAVSLTSKVNDVWESVISYSIMQDHISQVANNDNAFTDRTATEWQNNFKVDSHVITTGVNSEDTDVASLSFGTVINKKSSQKGVYFQDDITFGSNRVIAAFRTTDHDIWGYNTTYNLDYGYDVDAKLKLTAGIGTGFRAPSFTSLYGFGGNVNLKPELSISKEVGLGYQITDNQRFSVSVFDNEISDLIFAKSTSSNVNIEKAKITGTELQYGMHFENWSISSGLIDQNPQDVTNNVVLSRRAKQYFTLNTAYKLNKLTVAGRLLSVGERDDSYYNVKTLDAYNLIHLNIAYDVNKNIRVSSAIENLGDEKYETASGYPAKGRSVFFTLKYQQ